MKTTITAWALMSVLLAPAVRANNPNDLDFHATFVKQSAAFQPGEPIAVEISYSATAAKKYRATWVAPMPFFGSVEVDVTPREGVIDLRELQRLWAGSILSSEGYVDSTPRVQQLELNQWFRFWKPGHYTLTVKSNAVSRIRGEDEGGGYENLTLETEPIQFDVLPEDATWDAAELEEIAGILEQSPKSSVEWSQAMHRLSILDSPTAVAKLVEIYLSGPQADPSGNVYRGLDNSGRGDLIIALLKEGLSDPAKNPHALGADLLAEFEVRKELGGFGLAPTDDEGQKRFQEKLAERQKKYNEYFGQANQLILASLKKRSGKPRAEATYEAWNNAERENAGSSRASGVEALREEVLGLAGQLEAGEQLNFVSSTWGTLSHEQLRPIIYQIISEGSAGPGSVADQAYDFLCRDWPRDCAAAILAEAQRPGTKIDKYVILRLPEAEHPELDAILETGLRSDPEPPDWIARERFPALVLRAGSRQLVKNVQHSLDHPEENRRFSCEGQAALLGYLFRFAPTDAAKRTLGETLADKTPCGGVILHTLAQERYSEELLPIAAKTLDSANLNAANTAALLLGQSGGAEAQPQLRSRLKKLWDVWGEHAAQVRGASSFMGQATAEARTAQQIGQLEQALVSALVNGTNWKLTDEEREELRAGCLTENCRAIAEKKMSLGF